MINGIVVALEVFSLCSSSSWWYKPRAQVVWAFQDYCVTAECNFIHPLSQVGRDWREKSWGQWFQLHSRACVKFPWFKCTRTKVAGGYKKLPLTCVIISLLFFS